MGELPPIGGWAPYPCAMISSELKRYQRRKEPAPRSLCLADLIKQSNVDGRRWQGRELERLEWVGGIRYLAKRWTWAEANVRTFIKQLARMGATVETMPRKYTYINLKGIFPPANCYAENPR